MLELELQETKNVLFILNTFYLMYTFLFHQQFHVLQKYSYHHIYIYIYIYIYILLLIARTFHVMYLGHVPENLLLPTRMLLVCKLKLVAIACCCYCGSSFAYLSCICAIEQDT
jgi:ABC-type enterochelin transport system permease subunit